MSVKKQICIAKSMIERFSLTFSIHQFLIHLNSITKSHIQPISSSTAIYNLRAFLTMDKGRKIMRQKQDGFMSDLIKRVYNEFDKIEDQKVNSSELFKISYVQLQKFLQLFHVRNQYFRYLEGMLGSFIVCTGEKEQRKNRQVFDKMKRIIEEFQNKLSVVVQKYEEKTKLSFPSQIKPRYHAKTNQTQQNSTKILTQPNQTNENFQPLTIIKRKPQQKSTIVNKIGQLSSNQQKINKYKTQIAQLKSIYSRMNCKTEHHCNIEDQLQAKKTNLRTEPNEECERSAAAASEMKFSIRLTTDKRNTKISTSFSIFDKSTKNASFFVRTSTKPTLNQDDTINSSKVQRTSLKPTRQSSFLKKKSSPITQTNSIQQKKSFKKSANSVYRQTGHEAIQHKSTQKRVSTANLRQSLQKNDQPAQNQKRKTYMPRTSQTEANIVLQNNQEQQQEEMIFDDPLQEPRLAKKEQSRVTLNIQDQIDEDQKNQDNQQQDQLQNDLKDYTQKNSRKQNNRRKGFSKKRIDVEDDDNSYKEIPQQSIDSSRRSSIWDDAQKKQRSSIHRTSFFSASGHLRKKTVQKIGKARFNTNFNKKLIHRDSRRMECLQTINDQIGTQKTIIHQKPIFHDKTRKYIKPSQFFVTYKDCASLHQQITRQSTIDKQQLYPVYVQNMMRKKYDLNYKSLQEEEEQFQGYSSNLRNGLKLRVLETEVTDGNRKSMWNEECDNYGEIDFAKIVLKKFNQLGQKDLDQKKNGIIGKQVGKRMKENRENEKEELKEMQVWN